MSFIAGPYTVTYDSNTIGIVEDAPSFEVTPAIDPIVGDNMGDSVQDGVYRGGNFFVDMVLQEYNQAGGKAAFWPYHATFGVIGVLGTLLSSYAKALVFTAVAGTTATPSTVTFTKAVLAPGFPVRTLWGTRLRNVPIRLQALPFNGGSPAADRWFL